MDGITSRWCTEHLSLQKADLPRFPRRVNCFLTLQRFACCLRRRLHDKLVFFYVDDRRSLTGEGNGVG